MATQHRIQEYLEKHRIGALFEDLMSKVVSDQPDDPEIYLARILHLRAERKGVSLRHTSGGERAARSPSPDRLMRTAPPAVGEDALAVAKQRGYERPWQTNSKRLKPKKGEGEMRKKEWEKSTKPMASQFDELFEESRQGQKSKDGRPKSPQKTTAWDDKRDDDFMFNNYGYAGPHKGQKETEDPLAGELSLAKNKPGVAKLTKPASFASGGGKNKGRKAGVSKHKQNLNQYILEAEQKKQDSGIEEDRDWECDNAVELMEDLEDLKREGVRNVKSSGVRMSKSMRQKETPSSQVRVSICARCATVMSGGLPSQPVVDAHFGNLPDSDVETAQASPTSARPRSARRFSADGSDEEFESVSQVTGPRRPVWQDSENEALTPRKGKHMLASNMSPTKGLPMYGTTSSEATKKKKGSSKMMRSEEFMRSANANREPLRQTWAPADCSEDEVTAAPSRRGQTQDGWGVKDYDTDSSFYGSPGGRKQRVNQAY